MNLSRRSRFGMFTRRRVGINILLLSFAMFGCSRKDDTRSQRIDHVLPGGYRVYHTSAHETIIRNHDFDAPDIPSQVLEVGWDHRFILAKQQVLTNRNLSPSDAYQIPVPHLFQFWIIDTSNSFKLYGPMSENAFAARRKQISVPDSIKLKSAQTLYE